MSPIPFFSPAAKGRREVLAVEGLVQHKHVTLGAPGVNSFTFLHDKGCTLIIDCTFQELKHALQFCFVLRSDIGHPYSQEQYHFLNVRSLTVCYPNYIIN